MSIPGDPTEAPWLHAIWAQLAASMRNGRLPHGVLLAGAAGSGHALLARQLLDAALCTEPDPAARACGQCRSCQLRLRGTHEDLHLIQPAEDRKSISIEQIRELGEQMAYAPQRALRRVALVEPAEAMSVAACNALLKTLEEPPAAALLILVSNAPRALLPTLRSRCGQWLVPTPEAALAGQWVRQQLGCSAEEAHWRLALNADAVQAAIDEDAVAASLELAAALLELLGQTRASAAELVRTEKPRLALLLRVAHSVLSLSARPTSLALPAVISRLLALTATIDSSSLQRLARELWQVQRWSGTGVREDLQVLAALVNLRGSVQQRHSTAQA